MAIVSLLDEQAMDADLCARSPFCHTVPATAVGSVRVAVRGRRSGVIRVAWRSDAAPGLAGEH
jgi:hypothetical protein